MRFNFDSFVADVEMKIIIITLVCTLLIADVFGKSARIINGQTISVREIPSVVSIRFSPTNIHLCGGAIISNKHVLTAAFCVLDFQNDWSNLKVFAGTSTLSAREGSAYAVEQIVYHPRYNEMTTGVNRYHHDLAILIVAEFIEFDELRNKIDLPTRDIRPGAAATICGFGSQNYQDETYSNNLRKSLVRIMNYRDCTESAPFPLLDDQFCTYTKDFNAGYGDYGGPVISGGKLAGIMIYKSLVHDGADVQSNVFKNLDFINDIVR